MQVFGFIFQSIFIFLSSIAVAKVPRPAWDCADEKIIAKYHGESCTSDLDCFGRSMKCQEEKCACNEDYVTAERFVGEQAKQTVCVPAPSLHGECSTVCQKPYTCKQHVELNKKMCHCDKPFKLTDNYCHLECKENEYYDSSAYRCIEKCTANEIRNNHTCLKLGRLNDACIINEQCLPAFSECKNGQCSCLEGLSSKDGQCIADEIRCPNGQVMKPPRKCQFMKNPESKDSYNARLIDDCPAEHFCQTVGGAYRSENAEGFCCPKIESNCPIGKPHPTARCNGSPLYREKDPGCPWTSHTCISSQNGGHEVCCPKRCDSNKNYINGTCYPTARLNDPCLVDGQCTDSRTSCINGVCRCSGKATEFKRPTYSYCTIECPNEEMLYNDQCFKRLSLGDSCLNQTWRCPPNAFCNKFNVCSCSCPKFTLSKDICAPVPVCPAPRRYYPHSMARGMAGMPANAEIKYYTPISDEKRKELLQNVTFCIIPGKEAPKVEYVEQCPEGQYCANFITNLGMCCRIPDYVCPNGKKPTSVKQCSPNNPLSCGLKKYCRDYLYTADSNSPDGKMCCEKEESEDFE